jgi:hydrogenase expression/formation protein HypC
MTCTWARSTSAGFVNPEAQVGDYVLVHVGVALSRVDEAEARQVFEFLERLNQLDELKGPSP